MIKNLKTVKHKFSDLRQILTVCCSLLILNLLELQCNNRFLYQSQNTHVCVCLPNRKDDNVGDVWSNYRCSHTPIHILT